MHVAHDGAPDEDVLDGAQVRVPHLLVHRDVVQLDVEVLVHALERARDLDVVLELDRDRLVDQGLEETVCGVFCFVSYSPVRLFLFLSLPWRVVVDFSLVSQEPALQKKEKTSQDKTLNWPR